MHPQLPDMSSIDPRDQPVPVAPYEIVPFANMDGLQLTEGRDMPDRRDSTHHAHSRTVRATISREQLLDVGGVWPKDDCPSNGPRRARRRLATQD